MNRQRLVSSLMKSFESGGESWHGMKRWSRIEAIEVVSALSPQRCKDCCQVVSLRRWQERPLASDGIKVVGHLTLSADFLEDTVRSGELMSGPVRGYRLTCLVSAIQ